MNANVPPEVLGYWNPHRDTRNHSAVPPDHDAHAYIRQVIIKNGNLWNFRTSLKTSLRFVKNGHIGKSMMKLIISSCQSGVIVKFNMEEVFGLSSCKGLLNFINDIMTTFKKISSIMLCIIVPNIIYGNIPIFNMYCNILYRPQIAICTHVACTSEMGSHTRNYLIFSFLRAQATQWGKSHGQLYVCLLLAVS